VSHVEDEKERIVTITTTTKHYHKTKEFEVVMTKQYGDWDFDMLRNDGKIAWYYIHPQRGRANNSVALNRNTGTFEDFQKIMKACENSKAGEPGVYWCNNDEDGANPCVEIGLLPNQFCNLTTAVVYNCPTQEELERRVKAAAFIGTLQAAYTDFHMLRPIWKENTEKEALLGVSLTGIASGDILKLDIKAAANVATSENRRIAAIIGINPAARVTCIKPEGSGTLVAGAMGNGVHAVHAKYYIRNNRIKKGELSLPMYILVSLEKHIQEKYQEIEG
jgi:ribonucleoside-diphosphate reductase alpha chain